LVFRWITIPFVQVQLDVWLNHRNRTKPRRNKYKVIPQEIPELLRAKPGFYGVVDLKIPVTIEILDELEAQFAPADHEVFQLTPPEFDPRANTHLLQSNGKTNCHTQHVLGHLSRTPGLFYTGARCRDRPLHSPLISC
ncbi:hypothetical protein DFH09DRAFT_949611, partial [Mycena vulgaris]